MAALILAIHSSFLFVLKYSKSGNHCHIPSSSLMEMLSPVSHLWIFSKKLLWNSPISRRDHIYSMQMTISGLKLHRM